MKAWIVWWGYEFCTLMHAETRGKAKVRGMQAICGDDYLELRALRLPGLDNKPITHQNAKDAGFQYIDSVGGDFEVDTEGYILPEEFTNDCNCDICRGKMS